MNCQNCPAFAAYGINTSADMGCTFDYFAWSAAFLTHHGDAVVESSIVDSPEFQKLRRVVVPALEAPHRGDAEDELHAMVREGRQHRSTMAAKSKRAQARVAHVGDILEARNALL